MIGPDHRLIDRLAEPQIGLNGLNLADIAKRLEMSGKVGAAAGDADARTTCLPTNPDPPKTTTSLGVCRISVMTGSGYAPRHRRGLAEAAS
jgi:hypothetical protein